MCNRHQSYGRCCFLKYINDLDSGICSKVNEFANDTKIGDTTPQLKLVVFGARKTLSTLCFVVLVLKLQERCNSIRLGTEENI